jgi:muramidase (phage lysozyme)
MRAGLLIGAAVLVGGAWYVTRDTSTDTTTTSEAGAGIGESMGEAVATLREAADKYTGGILKLSQMRGLDPALINDRNVQAFFKVIRTGEGTADGNGYRRMFGGELFSSFHDHPRKLISKSGYTSTAAGAYQALASTWDETANIMGLPDFSPNSQDKFALGRIAARGALGDVLSGEFELAVRKCAKEWASLPFSPYGQPTISLERAKTIYANAGGSEATA